MLQAGKRKRLNRVPWNREDVYDIWFLVHNTAGFITQLQKLRSMSMCEPFEVKLDGMRAEQKREMDYLQKTFWLKSVYDIFVWKLCYGIVPYFEKTIQGTAHRIPVVPEITQGTLFVYEDRDRTKVTRCLSCQIKQMPARGARWHLRGDVDVSNVKISR